MARRRKAEKRKVAPDARYDSLLLGRMVTSIMMDGKKSTAQGLVYGALEELAKRNDEDPMVVLEAAIDNVKPRLEVKSRRVGGATYQVPLEVSGSRQVTLALRWIIGFAKTRKGVPMSRALAMELSDAYNNTGASIKKRDDTHKMAQANKAFAHYRW